MAYKAVIAGANGLIGSDLLDILLQQPQYEDVLILVRKELPIHHIKLRQLVVNFERLTDYKEYITGHAVFCCLGSTRKKTPDLNEYKKIDHDYPLQLAQMAQGNRVGQYHLVSALGANHNASNFYTRMKGETEKDIENVGLSRLDIYRPALLTGRRKEYRPLERVFVILMKMVDPLLIGRLKKYRSIPAATVAMAMFKQSIKREEGIFIHSSDEIKELA